MFLDSLDKRVTQDFLVEVAFLEILEISGLQAHLVTQAYLQLPLWSRENEDPLASLVHLVVVDLLVLLDVTDFRGNRVSLEVQAWRVLLVLVDHLAGRET